MGRVGRYRLVGLLLSGGVRGEGWNAWLELQL